MLGLAGKRNYAQEAHPEDKALHGHLPILAPALPVCVYRVA